MRNYEREPQHFLQSRTTPLNLPFPGGTSTSGLQQKLPFASGNSYFRDRPEHDIHDKPRKALKASRTEIPAHQLQIPKAAKSGQYTFPTRLRHQAPVWAVQCEHPVVAGQIHPRPLHQRRQPRHKIQGIEDDMRGTVALRRLQMVCNIAMGRKRQSRIRNGRVPESRVPPIGMTHGLFD